MASTVLSTISKDWEERCRLESELKYELDTQSWRVYSKKMIAEAESKVEEAGHKVVEAERKVAEAESKVAEAECKIEEAEHKITEAERKTEELQKVVTVKDEEIVRLRAELEKRT